MCLGLSVWVYGFFFENKLTGAAWKVSHILFKKPNHMNHASMDKHGRLQRIGMFPADSYC